MSRDRVLVRRIFLEATALPLEERRPFLERACAGDVELLAAVKSLIAEPIFSEAMALPPEERDGFLERACTGDAEFLAYMKSLMRASGEAGPTLAFALRPQGPWPEIKGTAGIERYKLRKKLGEGGCGVVYEAEQLSPVSRIVALKILRAEIDSPEAIARFEAERQALAQMDHPAICKVLDAGETKDGRPFFVMELVRGVPITKYCDDYRLGVPERLELFQRVCHAVQHAHQKGIIHRDIKPPNILVTLDGEMAAPKVIDFGIAKAIQGRLIDRTLVTRWEQLMGTPEFMAPEQVDLNGLDIDTRTDVYALGVLLYVLLSGKLPFDPKELREASLTRLREIICETEPPRPSGQLTDMAASRSSELGEIAQRRSIDAARLAPMLAGDLDWIVMKALEKARVRRYESPVAMADDIARHLRHEPVIARPPSNAYKIGKFMRRNRAAAAAAAVVLAVLVAGVVASTWQAVRAKQAERLAELERHNAVEDRKRADALLAFMLGELRDEVQKVGKLDLLTLVGTKATEYFATLDPKELTDAALSRQIKALRQIAEVQMRKAQYAETSASLEAAAVRAVAALERHPSNSDILYEYAQVQFGFGQLFYYQGMRDQAATWLTRYRDSAKSLVASDPKKIQWQRELIAAHYNLAVLDYDRGLLDDARDGFNRTLPLLETCSAAEPGDYQLQARIAETTTWMGMVAHRRAAYREASDFFESNLPRFKSLIAKEPKNTRWSFELANLLSLQADVLSILGAAERNRARENLTEADRILRALIEQDPANREWLFTSIKVDLKNTQLNLAEGRFEAVQQTLDRVRPQLESLVKAEPTDRNFRGWLITVLRANAQLGFSRGSKPEESLRRALTEARALIKEDRADDRIVGECMQAYIISGLMADMTGNTSAAMEFYVSAFELARDRMDTCADYHILDPALRSLALLGQKEKHARLLARLSAYSYVPIFPWPEIKPSPFR